MVDTYYTQEDALEAVERDPFKYIWTEEKFNVEGRRFRVGYHFDLIFWYESLTPEQRKVHEFIFHDRPLHCFFDLDCERTKITEANFEKEVNRIIEKEGGPDEVCRLDSSRESKFSVHLVTTTVFENMVALREYIMETYPTSEIIDYRLYESTRSMRMAFSGSNRGNPPIMGWNITYSRTLLHSALIHYCPDYDGPRGAITNWKDVKFNKILTKSNPICRSIYEWANKKEYQVVSSIKEDNTVRKIGVILKGVICLSINRMHKSHNTYLTIYLPTEEEMKREYYGCRSIYTCPDPACMGCTWTGPNFSTILFREEILKSLQPLLKQ